MVFGYSVFPILFLTLNPVLNPLANTQKGTVSTATTTKKHGIQDYRVNKKSEGNGYFHNCLHPTSCEILIGLRSFNIVYRLVVKSRGIKR